LSGVCKYVDDSECSGTEALGEEADTKGFTSNYTSDIWSCQSLWVVQAGYEGEDREVIATISGLIGFKSLYDLIHPEILKPLG
jgi:hypothetical protein